MIPRMLSSLAAAVSIAVAAPARADDEIPQQDFLFLFETAYTQEQGEWQATAAADWQRDPDASLYAIEFEYGITDRFQVSVELPFLDEDGVSGIGDVEFGAAYALLKEDDGLPEFTIAAEARAPSGDEDDGLGVGGWGYGAALRASKLLMPRLYGHASAAYEWVPNGGAVAEELDEWSFGAGLGFQPEDCVTLTAEVLHEREREVEDGEVERERETYLSVGAIFEPADDILVGVAGAFGVSDDSADARLLAKLQAEW